MSETSSFDDDYTPEETAFMMAMDCYKRANNRKFPTWREVLGVLEALGYQRNGEVCFTSQKAREVFQRWFNDRDTRRLKH